MVPKWCCERVPLSQYPRRERTAKRARQGKEKTSLSAPDTDFHSKPRCFGAWRSLTLLWKHLLRRERAGSDSIRWKTCRLVRESIKWVRCYLLVGGWLSFCVFVFLCLFVCLFACLLFCLFCFVCLFVCLLVS